MSNPTTKVATFNGSLDGFTGSGPERYSNGLWLEEGTTNRLENPSVETNTTNWAATAGLTFTHDTGEGSQGAKSVEVVAASGAIGKRLVAATSPGLATAGGGPVATAIDLWGTGTVKLQSTVDYTDAPGDAGALGNAIVLSATPTRYYAPVMASTNGAKTIDLARVSVYCQTDAVSFNADGAQVEWLDHATSFVVGTRAASFASLTMDEPASVACWYREGYSGAKSFAYLPALGTLGTYGSIAWAGGTLTISTSRNLVIGPFAAFDRALTAKEQANLARTQSWSLSTVFGRNPYINFQLRPY